MIKCIYCTFFACTLNRSILLSTNFPISVLNIGGGLSGFIYVLQIFQFEKSMKWYIYYIYFCHLETSMDFIFFINFSLFGYKNIILMVECIHLCHLGSSNRIEFISYEYFNFHTKILNYAKFQSIIF